MIATECLCVCLCLILETSTVGRRRRELGCWATENKVLKGRENYLLTYFKYVRYEGLMYLTAERGSVSGSQEDGK